MQMNLLTSVRPSRGDRTDATEAGGMRRERWRGVAGAVAVAMREEAAVRACWPWERKEEAVDAMEVRLT